MSRTIKTTPKWVRMEAAPTKLAVEHHDHRNGRCELEEDPTRLFSQLGECCLEPSTALLYGPGHGCGCAMCSEQDWRRAARRRERRAGRREARQAARERGEDS